MIYHIATRGEWEDQDGAAEYAPSAFAAEGFIHCCDRHQLETVGSRYFPGRKDLVALAILPTKLESETRYERSGDERFPHIYGPINKGAISTATGVQCNADGLFDGAFAEL